MTEHTPAVHTEAARRVYDHSARQYVDAVGTEINDRFEASLDQAILEAFSEQASPGLIIDAGCGTGRVAAFLDRLGHEVVGVDIAAGMIAEARAAHPDIPFRTGSLDELEAPDESAAGIALWYSIIATPPSHLPAIWTEVRRVAQPGAVVLLAFQAGNGQGEERPDAYGSGSALTLYQHDIDNVADGLHAVGFVISTRVLRQPTFAHESTPQAFLIGHLPRVR